MNTEITNELPEKIYAVEYAGFWDFSPDGCYGDSLINAMDFPNAEQIALEIQRRYNSHAHLLAENKELKEALSTLHSMTLYKLSPEDDRDTHLPSELFDKIEFLLKK